MAKYFSAEKMGLKNEDSCSESESESDVLYKPSKITYTRHFLLPFAELDICKELPCGFDPSILRAFNDACNGVIQRQRTPGDASLLAIRGSEQCSSQYFRDLVSSRHHSNQHHLRWHDGLLGSGGFRRVHGFTTGASAPSDRGMDNGLLKRSDAPYRPPSLYKAPPHSRRENNDSYNIETVGSAECLSKDRQDKERKRQQASFELMRKDHKKEIQGNLKQIADAHEDFDPDDPVLSEDSRKMIVNENSESTKSLPQPVSDNESAKKILSIQTAASGPFFPPGFTSGVLLKNSGTKWSTNHTISEDGRVEIEDNLRGGRSSLEVNVACDNPEGKESKKHANDQQHGLKRIIVPFLSDGEKSVIPSSDVDIWNKLANFDNAMCRESNFPVVCVAQEDEVTDVESVTWENIIKMSGLILEEPTGCASMINSGSEEHVVKGGYMKNPISFSSNFALWFREEENKLAGGASGGGEACGYEVHTVSNGRSTGHDHFKFSSNRNELVAKPIKSPKTFATDGISESFDVPSHLEQSVQNMGFTEKINPFKNASSVGNIENSKKNQHLREIFGTCVAPQLQSNDVLCSIQRRSVGRLTKDYNLEPYAVPPSVAENNFFPSTVDKCRSIGTIGEHILSTVDKCRSIGAIGEGFLASNRAKQTELLDIGEHGLGFDDAWDNAGFHPQIDQDSKLTPVIGFKNKVDPTDEICLPEEDSLITIDDILAPLHPMNIHARNSIHADFFNSRPPASMAGKLAAQNAVPSHGRFIVSGSEDLPFVQGSDDVIASETSYLNNHERKSNPKSLHSKMNSGRQIFRPDCYQTQKSCQIKSRNLKSSHHNPPLHHHLPHNVLPRPFQNTRNEPTRFDHPVHYSLLEQMQLVGNFPHPLSDPSKGTPLHPTDLAFCRQNLNPLKSFPLNYQQPSNAGLGMQDFGVGGNNNQVAYNKQLER